MKALLVTGLLVLSAPSLFAKEAKTELQTAREAKKLCKKGARASFDVFSKERKSALKACRDAFKAQKKAIKEAKKAAKKSDKASK
jgi:hypothetical protein